VLASLHQAIGERPQGAVVLAEDETHVNLLPWVRATWIARGTRQQVMTLGKNRRRTVFGALDLHTGRWFYQVARKAVSASFIAFLEQLAAAYPAAPTVAVICDNVIMTTPRSCSGGWPPTLESWCCMGRATARMTTGRADLGDAQGVAGRLPDGDHPGPHPPGPRLVPPAQPHRPAGHRRAAQLTLAAPGLHAELPGGRLGSDLSILCAADFSS
jgi:DDE superfamily endonuclease